MKAFTVSERAYKGIHLCREEEGPTSLVGVPLGQWAKKRIEAVLLEQRCTLDSVDVVPDGAFMRLVAEEHATDRRALVHVTTAPGVNGTVFLTANTVRESLRKSQVVRDARPIEEAVGVTVLGKHENEFLVAMEGGAGFRIQRTGLLEGAAPELTVLWKGRWNARGLHDLNSARGMKYTPDELLAPWGFQVRVNMQRQISE